MNIILENEIEQFRKKANTYQEKLEISALIAEKLKKKKIIIYGAGAAGTSIYKVMKKRNIPLQFFVDRKFMDIKQVEEIKVYSPKKLQEIDASEYMIIVSVDPQIYLNFKVEIMGLIEEYCGNIDVVHYGRNLIDILKYEECFATHEKKGDFSIIDCINCGSESRGCGIFEDYIRRISATEMDPSRKYSKKFNQFFGYILGQSCTLRCQNCCEMVPHLPSKGFADKETVIQDCKKMADACEFITYIEMVGGEPFLHPQFEEILRELLKIKRVGYIKTFTNGTIIPSDSLCEVLKDNRMIVTFSNYTDVAKGKLLENIYKTKEKFDKEGVRYIFSSSKTWLDFTSFDLVEKEEEKLKQRYQDCFLSHCRRLYQGILYSCPHHYSGAQLEKLDMLSGEYIDIHHLSTDELASALDQLQDLEYIDACKYCAMPYAKEIPAGLQLEQK